MNPINLRLPATSANLGPGFDALGLALDLWLEIDARESDRFAIDATGRNSELVSVLERNLILETYKDLAPASSPLHLEIRNGIPLGMGCGSSAAALLAGVLLANHFGQLGWGGQEILNEACRREGHPDNVAACFHGGLTASAMTTGENPVVTAVSLGQSLDWRLLLALPSTSLSTSIARALLPDHYSRIDAVRNVQATALLVSAFALDRPDLLAAGTQDWLHQPYRLKACPLLEKLLPLAGNSPAVSGINAVTLSGAGPSVLLFVEKNVSIEELGITIRSLTGEQTLELMLTRIASGTSVTPLLSSNRLP